VKSSGATARVEPRTRGLARARHLPWIALAGLALGACHRAAPSKRLGLSATGERHISIAITADGFVPERSYATAGEPVSLVVTRMVEQTCARDIVLEDFGILVPLVLRVPTEVHFTPTQPGRIRFAACAIDMVAGEIVVE
jgi:plastocyanin domain-containing protein